MKCFPARVLPGNSRGTSGIPSLLPAPRSLSEKFLYVISKRKRALPHLAACARHGGRLASPPSFQACPAPPLPRRPSPGRPPSTGPCRRRRSALFFVTSAASAASSRSRSSTTTPARWAASSTSTSARKPSPSAASRCMGENDHVITAYRDHGHALAVGMGMNECMAELFGKRTGCSKGKGGSMHFFAPDKNYWGGHGIVAGQTPLGTGLAYGLKYKGLKGAACASSAMARSTRAASTRASTSPRSVRTPGHLHHREQRLLDGHQPEALQRLPRLPRRARRRLRHGLGTAQRRGPLRGPRRRPRRPWNAPATRAKPTASRDRHLPLPRPLRRRRQQVQIPHQGGNRALRARARPHRHLSKPPARRRSRSTEAAASDIDQAAIAEAEAAAKFAEESAFPEPADIFDDVYWEVDNNTEAGQTGRHFFND